ncbi:MAG: hypothetical protein IPI91_18940 [Flavobacteriales bacterium]|nr:hypothetical protein [Flavobacteriales bacterium]
MDTAQKGPPRSLICGIPPPDGRANAERLYALIKPRIALFVKYEFWYHHLKTLHHHNVPLFLISGTFRNDQHSSTGMEHAPCDAPAPFLISSCRTKRADHYSHHLGRPM